jgi:RNA recognition motif-containing protein
MKNLYVGNRSHSTTEAELRSIFEAHGAVEKITLMTDRNTGRSRGFAFVEMTSASEADKAIVALNGTDLGGRTLTINEAKSKSERPRGGGHRFGGGGGRGETTIAAIHGSRANSVGSFFECTRWVRSGANCLWGRTKKCQERYAKRPINIYKAPKRTCTATETKGQGRA